MQGIDYSTRLPGSAVKAAGYTHVFRYLGDPSVWEKAMTQAEAVDLQSNGITVHLNYEQTADFMLGGYAAGQAFAKEARKWATWLGFSTNDTIYYSADFDVSDAQVSDVLVFLQGAADADGGKSNIGVYGGFKIIRAAINAGYSGWQTRAWSSGEYDTRAIALQFGTVTINGVDCDLNAMNPNNIPTGGSTVSGAIPQSIRDKWPAIANQFTGNYDDSTAILWADAGARYAAWQADNIMNKLNGMQAPGGPVNLTEADLDAIATRVVQKLSRDLAAG
jgi:hypothetical protein